MRSISDARTRDNVETINPEEVPVENGLPHKEDCEEAREVAAQVVEDVVRRAPAVAQQRTACGQLKGRGCGLQRLPTIQIDTVASPPPSPDEWTPTDTDPVDADDVQLALEAVQQVLESGPSEEELREDASPYIEELLTEAMVLAEKKLQASEEEEEQDAVHSPEEVREAAERVVEEVISKAAETAHQKMQNGTARHGFPVTFDDAPDDVKKAAEAFVKDIVGKAVALAEEKSVPTVPFNFEDPEVMKTSGPWYVRAREAFIGLLRTACFCTPRRAES